MTEIEKQVIDLIERRASQGRAKYGVGMDRTDLDAAQWLQHFQEKLLDAAIYVEKLKEYPLPFNYRHPGQAFARGDRVRKVKGYKFPGVVVAAFTTLEGNWRYVVQCTAEDTEGILHIYNAGQLEAAGGGAPVTAEHGEP